MALLRGWSFEGECQPVAAQLLAARDEALEPIELDISTVFEASERNAESRVAA
jgi:hypothetical protein